MFLKKSWAIANDLFFMPASLASFTFAYGGDREAKPYANPGKLVCAFNVAAVGLGAVGGVLFLGPSEVSAVQQIQMAGMLVSGISGAIAVNFAMWGAFLKAGDRLKEKLLGDDYHRIYRHSLKDYMFPRYSELSKPGP